MWQATTLIAAALVLGIPLGSAGGRLAWSVFSTGLGVEADPVVPAFQLAIAVPAAILVANAIAAVPAFLAGRTRPAVVLAREAATRA